MWVIYSDRLITVPTSGSDGRCFSSHTSGFFVSADRVLGLQLL